MIRTCQAQATSTTEVETKRPGVHLSSKVRIPPPPFAFYGHRTYDRAISKWIALMGSKPTTSRSSAHAIGNESRDLQTVDIETWLKRRPAAPEWAKGRRGHRKGSLKSTSDRQHVPSYVPPPCSPFWIRVRPLRHRHLRTAHGPRRSCFRPTPGKVRHARHLRHAPGDRAEHP